EDEFKEEEDPQEEEDDIEINIEEDENEPELSYPYKKVDVLNPLLPVSEFEPNDEIKVENPIEHEDKTIPASVHKIIMVNIIPPDYVDEVHVVEPNQHDDVPVVPEPVLVDEDEDPEEDEFKEEEDPQEEEYDMEINIEEDENEPELSYPYKEVDLLNPPPPVSEFELNDEIKVENPIEHEDKTILASVHKVAFISRRLHGRKKAHALVEKKGKAKDKFYGKLILELSNEVHSSVEQGTATMEKLVEKLGNTEDKVEHKKLKKELEEARGFVFEERQDPEAEVGDSVQVLVVLVVAQLSRVVEDPEAEVERPNEAINVMIEDEKSHVSEPRGSPHDLIMPSKSAPMTQAAIRRMIKDSVDVAIAA
nr:hypothetical protein [Tanacetum cinerariifolium]